jgi:hypothetical protein
VDIRPASREKLRADSGDNGVELEAAAETVIFGAPRVLGHGMESKILFFTTRKIPVRCNGIYIVKLLIEKVLDGHGITHTPTLLKFLFFFTLTNYQGIKSSNFVG